FGAAAAPPLVVVTDPLECVPSSSQIACELELVVGDLLGLAVGNAPLVEGAGHADGLRGDDARAHSARKKQVAPINSRRMELGGISSVVSMVRKLPSRLSRRRASVY